MWAGTTRSGLIRPGWTFPSAVRWQRLNLRPLPHQHGSFDLIDDGAAVGAVTPTSVGKGAKLR